MKVEYTLEPNEIYDYIYYQKIKPSIKRIITFVVIFLIVNLFLYVREEYPILFIELICLFFYIPIIIHRRYKLKKFIYSFYNAEGIVGDHEIEVLDEGFMENTSYNNSFHKWVSIKSVDS